MTAQDMPEDPVFAVLAPDGTLTWYGSDDEGDVEDLLCDPLPGGVITTAWLGPDCEDLKLMTCEGSGLRPDKFAPNPVAQRTITALSKGYVAQPWAGHVALYAHVDGFALVMAREWVERIRAAHTAATAGDHGSG